MKQNLFKIIVLLSILFNQFSYSQLSDFSLIVSKTDETCTGNGSLTFNVENISPGATIIYSIYLIPNVTTPINVTQGNTYTGLNAGNYRVVALQSLGNLNNSRQQDIQINSLITPLVYQISGQPQSCQNNGSITVNVTQGNPATYEILSGPIIVPPQGSNVFSALVAGVYVIRVNDICGDGVVQTYTLVTATTTNLAILEFTPQCQLLDCNTITGSFSILALENSVIPYPLTIVFTLQPPSGPAIVINQVVTSGNSDSVIVNLDLPFFNGQATFYSINVTDPCGNSIIYNDIIDERLSLNLTTNLPSSCSEGFYLNLCNFIPPYTVSFLSAPAGFNPILFNPNHPGPFSGTASYISTVNDNIPLGEYIVQVTDSCGRTAQDNVTVEAVSTDYLLIPNSISCDSLYTITIPNLGPLVTSVIITVAPSQAGLNLPFNAYDNPNGGVFSMPINYPGTYVFTGTNICGDFFSFEINIPTPVVTITANAYPGCNLFNGYIEIKILNGPRLVTVMVTDAPLNYGHTLPHDISNYISQPNQVYLLLQNLPVGNYSFIVTDSCGNSYILNATVPQVISNPSIGYDFLKGCTNGMSSIIMVSPNGGLQTVVITAAPPSFSQLLPFDVSFNIATNQRFYMNSLPMGSYTFYTKDICNLETTTTIIVPGYQVQDNTTIIGNCGSFNIDLQYIVNELRLTSQHRYWLQRLNPITNQWEHPFTGIVYINGIMPTNNDSYPLNNLTINYNFALTGDFRIIRTNRIYSNGVSTFTNCIEVIKEFEFNTDLKIIAAYTFPCSDGSNEVLIIAEGIPPLEYRITSKNGAPFNVNNGTSNIFSGLDPAIYNFQVRDLCGNIVNRLFDINSLPEPSIVPDNLCNGQNGQLSVQAISFLNYQWWKGTDTTTILSTTNVLTFNPFSNVTSPGTYYVRIYSSSPLSCVNKIISYVVPSISNPNAGPDTIVTICGSPNAVDLLTFLIPPFDNNGTWEELTTSGMLNGNIWLPIGIAFGTYVFKYTVTGFCDDIDDATVTINFNEGPSVPIITSVPEICENESINLSVSNIANATFQWTGPNNFTSNSQNIVIPNSSNENSGTYTVIASLNGCTTTAFIEVDIKPSPNFTIEGRCINGTYIVTVLPIDNSFDPNLVTYSWTGPNIYTNTSNPINLAGFSAGNYSVTVTNPEECTATQTYTVLSTVCSITNVITPNDDGSNDYFDLTGLDVSLIQIFSRWGRLVYEEENYSNQWKGQNSDGDRLPDSTYFYFIYLGSGEEKRGWVLLSGDTD